MVGTRTCSAGGAACHDWSVQCKLTGKQSAHMSALQLGSKVRLHLGWRWAAGLQWRHVRAATGVPVACMVLRLWALHPGRLQGDGQLTGFLSKQKQHAMLAARISICRHQRLHTWNLDEVRRGHLWGPAIVGGAVALGVVLAASQQRWRWAKLRMRVWPSIHPCRCIRHKPHASN